MRFAQVKLARDQLVLFLERLNRAVDADHDVRLVDKTLQSVDCSEWEARCELTKRPPPIHTRAVGVSFCMGCRVGSVPVARSKKLCCEARLSVAG